MAVTETVLEEAAGRMNIIVHIGCPNARPFEELARRAEKVGADAICAVPCAYYRVGEESMFQHWSKITEVADLPFFIYNIPQLTGFSLYMSLFRCMLKNEKVTGITCSSEPAQNILRLAGQRKRFPYIQRSR